MTAPQPHKPAPAPTTLAIMPAHVQAAHAEIEAAQIRLIDHIKCEVPTREILAQEADLKKLRAAANARPMVFALSHQYQLLIQPLAGAQA